MRTFPSIVFFGILVHVSLVPTSAQQPLVPGTGSRIDFVGDEFEDTAWSFIHNHPKSSREDDERLRFPVGKSVNGRWYEGPERGQPDMMKVVPTPANGLVGSDHALLVRTLNSGIPGVRSFDVKQDDLIVDCINRIGNIPASESPNVTTRVYLPSPDEWEDRSGPHFGFRITTNTVVMKSEPVNQGRFIRRTRTNKYRSREQYWPGIWVHFRSKTDPKFDEDSAFLTVRGNRLGHDFHVRDIPVEEFGWWTLGMSVTPNGMVHYYAKPGVEELTEDDFLTSQYPYSYRAEIFETFFYNFCNKNDGQTWSTPFVIDDPQLYLVNASRVESIVERKRQSAMKQAQRNEELLKQQQQQAVRAQQELRKQQELARTRKERLRKQQQQAYSLEVQVDDAVENVRPTQKAATKPAEPMATLRNPLQK